MQTISEIRAAVHEYLQKKGGMISKTRLQRHIGITDINDESQRGKVWKLSAVLAQLWKEKVIGMEKEYDFRSAVSSPVDTLYYSREIV